MELSTEQIERVCLLLSGVPNGAERALYNAVNRGLSTVRAQMPKEIQQVYAVKKPMEGAEIKTKSAGSGDIVGYISYAGYKLPLSRFHLARGRISKKHVPVPTERGWAMMTPGAAIRANVLKDNPPKSLNGAFLATMKNGHQGIFERPIRRDRGMDQLMGLSAAQMVGNANVEEAVGAAALDTVEKRLEHEITRILNGYGGGL